MQRYEKKLDQLRYFAKKIFFNCVILQKKHPFDCVILQNNAYQTALFYVHEVEDTE